MRFDGNGFAGTTEAAATPEYVVAHSSQFLNKTLAQIVIEKQGAVGASSPIY